MTPARALIEQLKAAVLSASDEKANANGASRDRSLDAYRFEAGVVTGLRQAATLIEDTYKRLLTDDDEED